MTFESAGHHHPAPTFLAACLSLSLSGGRAGGWRVGKFRPPLVRGQRGGREPERDSGQLSALLLRLVASSIPSSSHPVHPRKAIAFSAGPPPLPSSLHHPPSRFFLSSPLFRELSERGDPATSVTCGFQSLGVRASSAAPFLSSRDPIRYGSGRKPAPSPPWVDRLRVSPWGTAGAPRSAPTARRAAPSPRQG